MEKPIKFTPTEAKPNKVNFESIKDGEFFSYNDTIYKKVFSVAENGTGDTRIFRTPFGVRVETGNSGGYTESYGFRFVDNLQVTPITIKEIIFEI